MIKDLDINDENLDIARIQIPEGFLYVSEHGMCFVPKSHKPREKAVPSNDFLDFIAMYNRIMNRTARGDQKTLESFKARVREGWTLEDMESALKEARLDTWHRDSGFKWLTTEYITRDDKLNKYLSNRPKPKQNSQTYEELKRQQ